MSLQTAQKLCTFMILIWISCSVLLVTPCEGIQTYNDTNKLFEDKLGASSGYNTAIKPMMDQSKAIEVGVSFHLVAIVEIDAIMQKFVVNAFIGLYWLDELIRWDLPDYGYIYLIHPYPKQVWRPRLILSNTIEGRDLFDDDYSPLLIDFEGNAQWFPGSLFPASCKLNLYKYPFDTQTCSIEMLTMGLTSSELLFTAKFDAIDMSFYVESGEWIIENTSIVPGIIGDQNMTKFNINFELRRLPGFFVINIVIPIVLMSFLNILVFVIPVDSGEKISYGITVLLALTVFMSIVSEQLPRSSDTLPLVTIYLLVLTVISVCTVIVSILIVFFHHHDEKEMKHHRATSRFKGMANKIKVMNRTVSKFSQVTPANDTEMKSPNINSADKIDAMMNAMSDCAANAENDDGYVNRFKIIGRHLDCISFVVFMVIWISVTIGFLVEVAK